MKIEDGENWFAAQQKVRGCRGVHDRRGGEHRIGVLCSSGVFLVGLMAVLWVARERNEFHGEGKADAQVFGKVDAGAFHAHRGLFVSELQDRLQTCSAQ